MRLLTSRTPFYLAAAWLGYRLFEAISREGRRSGTKVPAKMPQSQKTAPEEIGRWESEGGGVPPVQSNLQKTTPTAH